MIPSARLLSKALALDKYLGRERFNYYSCFYTFLNSALSLLHIFLQATGEEPLDLAQTQVNFFPAVLVIRPVLSH